MKALISGQAGIAVLFDRDRISSLHYDSAESIPRTESDISYLLADATDVLEVSDVAHETVTKSLELACRKDESLHLLLILLDADADKEARQWAAECLDELLRDLRLFDFISNRLYAAPLPSIADLVGSLIYADRVGASWLANFLDELGSCQPDIRRWRAAWDALAPELFKGPDSKEKFGHLLVTSGALRKLVRSHPDDTDSLLFDCLTDPAFQALPNHRRILMDLVGPFRQVKRDKTLESEGEEEEDDFAKPRRARRRTEKPRRSFIAFETVNKQKEAIKRLLSEGNTERVQKYVKDLVEYQKNRSEVEDMVRSLCDLAQHAKTIGDHRSQLNLARSAAEMLPSDGWSQTQLGDAYLCLGQYHDALKAYDNACNHGQKLVSRCGRAEVLKSMGRLEEVLTEYDKAIQEFPLDVVPRNGRAEVLKSLGRLEEALTEYDKAVQEFPHNVVSRCGRAEVLKSLGRLEEALAEYDKAIQEFPLDVVPRSGRAEVLKSLGRLEEALTEYDKAIQEFPLDVVPRSGRAEVLKSLGRLEEALTEYDKAVQEFPLDVVPRNGRAEVLKSLGRLEEALTEYDKAVQEFPHNVVSRSGRAEVLKSLGRLEEALTEYDKAVQEFPLDVVPRNGRAEVLKSLGRLEEALTEYDKAVQEFPHNVVSRCGRAEVLKSLGRLEEALTEYDKAVQEFPLDVVPRNGRAEVLKSLGRLEEALAEYDKAIQEFPLDVVPRCGRASVFALLGRYREALALVPSESPTTLHEWGSFHIRGMVLLKKGDLDAAIEIFERGTGENPWIADRKYFRTALAIARLRQKEFQEAVQVIGDEPTSICQVLRIHAFGGLGDTERAKNAFDQVKDSFLPNVIPLRDELAARYVLHVGTGEQRSDVWVFQQECDLLLAA